MNQTPRLFGWQAAGSAPIVENRIIEKPETIATAIRIGNPASWKQAVAAASESKGQIDKVTDEEILEAYALVAKLDGVFCEPASAAPLAGLLKASKQGKIPAGSLITATLTGHGLKDPDTAMKVGSSFKVVPPTKDAVLKAVGF